MWSYQRWLPQEIDPLLSWPVGGTPLLSAPRLAERWGVGEVLIKNETANPTHSFKDRVVAMAVARAKHLGLDTVACTSTGNLGHALAAAAAAASMRCVVLIPGSVEPEKLTAARALGAQVVSIDGSYDDVNRTAHQLADEMDGQWGWVNMTLRPFYAEGSRTVIWEILDQMGDRPPTDVVVPVASGSLYTKLVAGAEWAAPELKIRFHGAQPGGCSPVADAYLAGTERVAPVKASSRAHSLAIGNPADGDNALDAARRSGGRIVSVPEGSLPGAAALLAECSGILTESAGATTTAAAEILAGEGKLGNGFERTKSDSKRISIESELGNGFGLAKPDPKRIPGEGELGPQSRVVLVITGDGLKGVDLLEDAVRDRVSDTLPPDSRAVKRALNRS